MTTEIGDNYELFTTQNPSGFWALIHREDIVNYYVDVVSAYREGRARYGWGDFAVVSYADVCRYLMSVWGWI